MLMIIQISLTGLLVILVFISLRRLGGGLWTRHAVRSRLSSRRSRENPLLSQPWLAAVHRHLKDVVEVVRVFPSVRSFLSLTLVLGLAGISGGAILFQSVRGICGLTAIGICLPYALLRMRLLSQQLSIRLEFLSAMEVFYQQVLLIANPNMRIVLQAVVSGDRLLYPVKGSFDQLHRNLSSGRDLSDALRVFRLEHNHQWADYYANMLSMAIEDGVDISDHLKELIDDMRRAQMYDQRARNRLLEIRLASFSPALFLGLFVMINLKLNYQNAVQFYFMTQAGRTMLLNGVLLIFASFLMGIYLSMKRM